MKALSTKLAILSGALIPSIVFADAQLRDVDDVTNTFTSLVSTATQILITVAVIYIIIHVVRYLVIGGSDPENRKLAGNSILYGIIGLFVILSIWGLVNILRNTFDFEENTPTANQLDKLVDFR